jgi:hypothetical protein
MEYYLALLTSENKEDEFDSPSYHRKEIFFDYVTGLNTNPVQFPVPREWDGWGVATHIAIFDRYSVGNAISIGIITTPITVNYGVVITIAAGSISLLSPIPDYTDCCTEILAKIEQCSGDNTETYVAHTVSNITANVSANQVYGTVLSDVTITSNITVGSKVITFARLKINDILVESFDVSTTVISYTLSEVDETTTFKIEVSDGRTVVTKEFTILYKYEIFYGRGAITVDTVEFSSSVLSVDVYGLRFSFTPNPPDNSAPYLWVKIPTNMPLINANVDFKVESNNLTAPFVGPTSDPEFNYYRSANQVNGSIALKT